MKIQSINNTYNTQIINRKNEKKDTTNSINNNQISFGKGSNSIRADILALALAATLTGCSKTEAEVTPPIDETEPTTSISAQKEEEKMDPVYHTIKDGDTTTKIISQYTGLSEDAPYKDFLPYIEIFMADNADTVKNADVLSKGSVVDVTRLVQNPIRYEEGHTPVWYKVQNGDSLIKIIADNGAVDEDAEYQEFLPFIEILMKDNPSVLSNPDILPKNATIDISGIIPKEYSTKVEENVAETTPAVTEPQYETSEDDTVNLNGNKFSFDLGTMNKSIFGNYSGLIHGSRVEINTNAFDKGYTVTKYDGADKKANKTEESTYDKNGLVTRVETYKNGEKSGVYTYMYSDTIKAETFKDLTKSSKVSDKIVTEYDRKSGEVLTVSLLGTNSKITASFNFAENYAKIGNNVWEFDSLEYNPDAIGANKYVGHIDGTETQFDALSKSFVVYEYGINGLLHSQTEYDDQGNIIFN